jgi:phage/plasmid-like protein (TIGR03299 family)
MRLGATIDEPVTAAEAARLGGLDFEVDILPAGFRNADVGNVADAGVETTADVGLMAAEDLAKLTDEVAGAPNAEALRKFGRRVPELLAHIARLSGATTDSSAWSAVANRRAVVRHDTREHFDFVSSDYVPVQYAEAFSFMDEVSPEYVAAGTLGGGRQGFMVVQSPNLKHLDLELNGEHDPHDLYGILRSSHNRSRGLEVAFMPLRHRCMNQLPLANFTAGAPQRWAIRHVGDPHGKMHEAARVINGLETYATAYAEVARKLVAVDVSHDEAEYVLRRVLPDRPKREDQVAAITAAWTESPHVGFTGTGWGLVNAVGEYFEHQRDSGVRTDQSRFTSGLEGATYKNVNRTAQLLLSR